MQYMLAVIYRHRWPASDDDLNGLEHGCVQDVEASMLVKPEHQKNRIPPINTLPNAYITSVRLLSIDKHDVVTIS